jgi:small subunit ribosomal protein S19e
MKYPSSVYVLPAGEYNSKLALLLKNMTEFSQPDWACFVKSGTSKVRPPQDPEFWHKRAASILRQIYIKKVVGVNRLRTRYGGRKKRGNRPEHFYKASGKMIRLILQQSEKAGLTEKYIEPGKRAGRKLTKKGIELLESIK